jgi:DNA-binding MarR family transcriptional regulator
MTENLFGIEVESAKARRSDPETSKEAAAKVNVTKRERQVLYYLRTRGPSTTKEIADCYLASRDSFSPRMKSLEERGLIIRTAERRDKATVWRLA